jgi:ABC-type multidrug transport system permease subunit
MGIRNIFRGFYPILYKEMIQMRRDPIALFFAFLPPLFQVIGFGYAIKTDVKHTPAIVYNLDQRQASREFLMDLHNTQYIDFVKTASSEKEMTDSLTRGDVYIGIEIPPDYSDKLQIGEQAQVLVLVDGSNSTIAFQALNVTNAVALRQSLTQILGKSGKNIDDMPIDTRPKVLYNPDIRSENFFVPGVIGVALQLVTTFLTAFAIVREKERGTMEQMIVTPVTKFGLLLGKLIPYIVLAVSEACFLFFLMVNVFKVPIAGNFFLLLGVSTVFIFINLSIGLLVSIKATTQTQAVQMSMFTLLPSIFLSGFIFPRFTMPAIFYWMSFVLPLTYFIDVIRGIILRGAGAGDLMLDIIVLSSMALVLFTLAVTLFKKQVS